MEQKRTLWIVAAAGVFLLVVAGAALILYSPTLQGNSQQTAYNPADGWVSAPKKAAVSPDFSGEGIPPSPFEADTHKAPPLSNDPFEFSEENVVAEHNPPSDKNAPLPQNNEREPIQSKNVTVITDNTTIYGSGTTTTIDLNALKAGNQQQSEVASAPKNSAAPAPQPQVAQAQPKSPPPAAPQQAPRAPSESYSEAKISPAPAVKPAQSAQPTNSVASTKSSASSSLKTTSASEAKPASTSAPAKPLPDSYWIQVGAYSAKKSADNARSILESNKIPSEVFTYKDASGKLFYRVRIGPYTTTSEAEYWKTRIAMISEFENANSYVTNANAKVR